MASGGPARPGQSTMTPKLCPRDLLETDNSNRAAANLIRSDGQE